LNNKYF